MAAGIIDHETGTRDMRQAERAVPLHADHRDAGHGGQRGDGGRAAAQRLPVEGDVLRRGDRDPRRFAARHGRALCRGARQRLRRHLFDALHPRRLLRPASPPTCRASRTSRRSGCALPIEFLVLACLVVGIVPGTDHRALPAHRGRRRCWAPRRPTYSLAVWHGFNLPLLMSVVALVGGALLYLALQGLSGSAARTGRRCFRRLKGQRIFERVMVALSLASGRGSLESRARHAPAAAAAAILLVAAAFVAALLPLYRGGLRPATAEHWHGVDPAFAAGSGASASSARSAPPTRPSIHRLAALVLLGGAGLVTCITFVWFSAPDLALTQLLVEIVTTVLILLGLRWLPKRFEDMIADRAPSGDAAAPLPRSRHRRRRRRRHGDARLRRDDAPAARHDRRLLPRERLYAKAAAAMSSTSSWSISAASTRWARSPCSASSR